MSVKIERLDGNKVKLEFELGADVLDRGMNEAYKQVARKFSVHGFRKGKAPRYMVERMYGPEVLYEGAFNAVSWEPFEAAVRENNLELIAQPEFDVVTIKKGEPLVYTVTCEVLPHPTLGQYKGLKAPYEKPLVTEDEVDAAVKESAERVARMVPVEDGPAQEGDTLTIDYMGTVDGVPFDGGKADKQSLVLGSDRFIKGFEEQLAGARAGEDVDVKVTFPEDYHAPNLAGKEAVFHVHVSEVRRKEVPEIDDDFAQDVSEFDTLEEYRQDIRKQLEERAEQKAEADYENSVIKQIVEGSQVEVSETLINKQVEKEMQKFEMSLAYRGASVKDYLAGKEGAKEELDKMLRERAELAVRTQLVLKEIAVVEDVRATDEDVDQEIRDRAKKFKKDYEEYRDGLDPENLDYIRDMVAIEKLHKYLREQNPHDGAPPVANVVDE